MTLEYISAQKICTPNTSAEVMKTC